MTLKGLLEKEMLMMGGGAVAGAFITSYIVSHYAGSLPGYGSPTGDGPALVDATGAAVKNKDGVALKMNTYVAIAYNVAIPLLGALALAKFNKPLAKGVALSGIITGLQSVVTMAQKSIDTTSTASKTTQQYLDATPYAQLSAPSNYDATSTFGAGIYANEPAFSGTAW
jgi:hypothetical protein